MKMKVYHKNTVKKGEISPFPTMFSKDLYCRHAKTGTCLERVTEQDSFPI